MVRADAAFFSDLGYIDIEEIGLRIQPIIRTYEFMLILDFRTGKMTKMASDIRTILAPGVAFGLSGAWIGGIIDRLVGTRDWKWSKRFGLIGLIGGLGLGIFNALPPPSVPTFKAPTKSIQALLDELNKAPKQTDKQQYGTRDISDRRKLFLDIMTPPSGRSGYLNIALYRATAARSAGDPAVGRVLEAAKVAATRRLILDAYVTIFLPEFRNHVEAVFNGYLDLTARALQHDVGSAEYANATSAAKLKLDEIAKRMRIDNQFELARVFLDPVPLIKELEKRQPR